jgi:hypothetical protein
MLHTTHYPQSCQLPYQATLLNAKTSLLFKSCLNGLLALYSVAISWNYERDKAERRMKTRSRAVRNELPIRDPSTVVL